jgi:hypothetical protein
MDATKDALFAYALSVVFADRMSKSDRYDKYNGDHLPMLDTKLLSPDQYSNYTHVTSPFAWFTTPSDQIEREKAVQLFICKNLKTNEQHKAFLKRFFEIMGDRHVYTF